MSSGLPPPTANPWLDWPRPISLVQPNLQITLSKFQCHISETAGYPYRLNTHSGTEATIYFHEMRGFGNPPGDVGYPGDVYIDMSSGGPFLWATQMTNNGEWKRWALDERMQHPHFPFRFLWCSKGEVSWYCPAKFEQLSNHEKGQRTAEELVVEMLRATGRGNDGASNAAFAQSKRLMLPASTFNSSSFGTSTSIYGKPRGEPYTSVSKLSSPQRNLCRQLLRPTLHHAAMEILYRYLTVLPALRLSCVKNPLSVTPQRRIFKTSTGI